MRKRILFICNVDWFFLSHRLPIGLELISRGYEVHLATKFTDKENFFKLKGFITHELEISRSKKNFLNMIKNFYSIFRLMILIKPVLVHAITIKPVILAGIASRFFRNTSYVASISGLGYVFISRGIISEIKKSIVKFIYKLALSGNKKKIIFQNTNDQNVIKKICNLKNEDFILIPGSGVDLNIYKPEKPISKPKIILFASRLLKSKGVFEYVESAKSFINSEYKFVIAGKLDKDNPDCITEEYLKSCTSERLIEYVGDQADIRKLINQSKIVVLPSYYGEGLPKILIEAAACGVPVITTNHPGCRDAIIPGKTGLLIPVKDSYSLIKALKTILVDSKLCEKMGRDGRELALRRYDIKKVINTHMDIYHLLTQNT